MNHGAIFSLISVMTRIPQGSLKVKKGKVQKSIQVLNNVVLTIHCIPAVLSYLKETGNLSKITGKPHTHVTEILDQHMKLLHYCILGY